MWRRSHSGTRTLRAALFCKHSVCSAWQMAGRRSCRFWNAAPSCATCALRSAVVNMNTALEMHVSASDHTVLPHVSVVVTMSLIFTQPQGLSQISTTFASSLTCTFINTVATGMAQDIEFRPYDLLVNPACFEYHHRHASAELRVHLVCCRKQNSQDQSCCNVVNMVL
jgi:hypothetical protein